MAYKDLILDIFYEDIPCIDEGLFTEKLPSMLSGCSKRISAEELALVVVKRYGLHGNSPLTLIAIAELIGVSHERVRQRLDQAIRYLRHSPGVLVEYVLEPSEEILTRHKTQEKEKWKKSLSRDAQRFIGSREKEDIAKLFSKEPFMMKWGAIASPMNNSSSIPISVFNEIRQALGIEKYQPTKKIPTDKEIHTAIAMLESQGYKVTKRRTVKSQSPPHPD